MKTFYLILSFMFIFNSLSFSQSSQKFTKNDKRKLADAKNYVSDENYISAAPIFKELIDKQPQNFELYTDLGLCYVELGNGSKAINYLEKSVQFYRDEEKIDKSEGVEALYLLANAYFLIYDFENAKEIYQEVYQYSNNKQKSILSLRIQECDSAQMMFSNMNFLTTLYYPSIINSDAPDYCPVVTADNSKLYFTSRRLSSTTGGGSDYDGFGFEDIYSVDINNGDYSDPVNIGIPLNSEYHEATSSISADGKELFTFKSTFKDNGDIFVSNLSNNTWSVPVRLPKPINSKSKETHACLTPDGKYLYFTSDRKKGKGGLDIYVVEKDADGNWGNLKNVDILNTAGDEDGPYLSPDGNTMYFSSNGRPGMGGYDIYKSEKQADGTWGTPENLGFPVNNPNDQIYFVPTNDPIKAYFTSSEYSNEPDICAVTMVKDVENMIYVKGFAFDASSDTLTVTQTNADSVLAGNKWYPYDRDVSFGVNDSVYISRINGNKLIDSVCKIPSNTQICVHNINDDQKSGIYKPFIPTGKYIIIINQVEEKLVEYKSENHIYDILKLEAKEGIVNYTAQLDTIVIGQVKNVKKSNFDLETTELSDYQKKEFKILADFMNSHPNLYVDISTFGYKDAPETFDQQRNNQIIQYLTDNNVDPDRIYSGLSPNNITGDDIEYTIYDEQTIQKAIEDKENNQIVATNIKTSILVTDISFDLNKYQTPDFYNELNAIADYLKDNPDAKIAVNGYTDTQGGASYNQALSKKRADFVKNYLIDKGASADQITSDGKGFSKQVSVNKNQDGSFMWNSLGYNRRVEIVVVEQGSNSNLLVKPVDVPAQYQINNGMDNVYSVMVVVSETQLPNSAFSFNVSEIIGVDGLYSYIYGEFDDEAKAQDFVTSIKSKYPKAYVFINNFRQ